MRDMRVNVPFQLQAKKEEAASRRKKLLHGTRIMGLGPGKQGFPVREMCMEPPTLTHTGKILEKIHSPRDWEKRDKAYRQRV